MDSDDSRTIWCGNLSNKVTEELLYELFLQAAPLQKVRIPTDKNGRQNNYAFVTFKHEQSVPYACGLLNGIKLFDQSINLKPRTNNKQQNEMNNVRNGFPMHVEPVPPFIIDATLPQMFRNQAGNMLHMNPVLMGMEHLLAAPYNQNDTNRNIREHWRDDFKPYSPSHRYGKNNDNYRRHRRY